MLAYSLVLIAMSFAKNISYVVAFRQLGIPIGAILGMVILKEPMYLSNYNSVYRAYLCSSWLIHHKIICDF
jgi:hypothetical protein